MIRGDAQFLARLRRAANVSTVMDKWANDSAEAIAAEARALLDEGGIPSPNHIPSTAPNPPNTDTGYLASRTQAEDLPEPGQAAAMSDAPYSLIQEFGGQVLPERPFMRPATANKRKSIIEAARKAVNAATKR